MSSSEHSQSNASVPPVAAAESAQGPGRGGLALLGGKIFFLVSGLLQQVVLKAILGLSGYGALSTTLSVASIAYNPLVQAGIQGLSRATSETPEQDRGGVIRRLLRFHCGVSLAISALFFAITPGVTTALGAPHVQVPVRILSGVLFLYGLYAPLVGVLNGQRRFTAQAGLDAFAAALRTIGLLGGAYLGVRWARGTVPSTLAAHPLPLILTCVGFVGAATLVLLVAARMVKWGKPGAGALQRPGYAQMLGQIWAGQFLLNLLFQADALLVRRFAALAAQAADLGTAAADTYVGAYRATQLFCFLPFQLLTSVTFVLFPLLASARGQGQTTHVAELVSRGLRLALLITGMLVSTLIGCSGGLLQLVFGAETATLAAPAMRILAFGMGAFALLGVMTSALNGLGRERLSLALIFVATALVCALCSLSLHGSALDARMLERAAWGTSLGMVLTTVAGAVLLHRVAHRSLALLSTARTLLSVAAASCLTMHFLPSGTLWTLLGAPLSAGLYILAQLALREITTHDAQSARALLKR